MILVKQQGNLYNIQFKYNQQVIELIKAVPGRRWVPEDKMWTIPADKLGFLIAQFKATPFESELKIVSQEQLNENATVEGVKEIPDWDLSDVNLYVEEGHQLFSHQIDTMKYYLWRIHNGYNSGFLLADEPGAGKAFTLDTKIYTPTGYKLMRDIQVGDKVFNERGEPVDVLATYDHESLEMYEVTFSDGKSVTCCKDHLWTILNNEFKSTTCSLSQIIDGSWRHQKNRRGYNYNTIFIPRCNPVQFEHQEVPLDPYLLGALLGDGSMTSSTIGFTTADIEMIDRLSPLLPEGLHFRRTGDNNGLDYNIVHKISPKNTRKQLNEVRQALRKLNLEGKNSHTKFIPEVYKFNSVDVRLSVLQGLIDTDGYANDTNDLVYTTVSSQLKDDVVFLVESLGQVCTEKFYTKTNSWDVRIRCDDPTIFCRLTRKKKRLSKRRFTPRRRFQSIKYVGQLPGKCITVSGPSKLYLCDHFIVTHNTVQIMNIAMWKKEHRNSKHCLIIVCVNSAKYNWVEDIQKHTNGKEHPYIIGSRIRRNGTINCSGSGKDKIKDLITGKMYGKEDGDPLPYFLVMNIESLRTKVGKTKVVTNEIIRMINDGDIDSIAIDEIHKNASPSSIQGQQLNAIKKKAKKQIEWFPLTGTPITSKPTDVFTPLGLIGGHTVTSFWDWCHMFCVYGGFGGKEIVGYKNIPYLKTLLQPNMLRRLKKDILDLPPKVYHVEYVENTPYQQKLYEQVSEELKQEKDNILKSLNPMTRFLRLRQVNGSPELVDSSLVVDKSYLSHNAKFQRALELIDEIVESGEKVVVFSNWVEPLRTFYRFISPKYKVCCYTGTMPSDEREKHKSVFINNPNYPIMIGTFGALGTSHTLTVASNIIFLDECWNPSDQTQAEDRLVRPGQNNTVNIYSIITKDTVDDVVHNILSKKDSVAKFIVDDELDLQKNPDLFDMLVN